MQSALAGVMDPTVTAVTDDQFVGGPGNTAVTSDLIVINNPKQQPALTNATTDPTTGAINVSGNDTTFVDNTSGHKSVVVAEGPTFITLGFATPTGIGTTNADYTVIGGDAPTFVVDASHNTGNVLLEASSGRSWLMGGNGPGTTVMYGSTATSGTATMTANAGPTTIFAGLGADTAYGGGNTVIHGGGTLNGLADTVAGAGDNQDLTGGYSAGASDTIYAGTGSNQTLAVTKGNNFLYAADTVLGTTGGTNDQLFAGSGNDLLSSVGSTHTTIFDTYAGNTTIAGGTGVDSVFVHNSANASESIDGGASGAFNYVTFSGHTAADVVSNTYSAATGAGVVTFNNGQTATLAHVTQVTFDTASHQGP